MPDLYPFSFFVKFDRELMPLRIVCKTYEELADTLARMVIQRGQVYEWIIRDYRT